MMTLDAKIIAQKCSKELDALYEELAASLCRTDGEMSSAFKELKVKIRDGVAFRSNRSLGQAELNFCEAIWRTLGLHALGFKDAREIGISNYSNLVRKLDREPSLDEFKESVCSDALSKPRFKYVGPCQVFEFDQEPKLLKSKYISVCDASEFLDMGLCPIEGKNWLIADRGEFGEFLEDGKFVFGVGGLSWLIDSSTANENARDQARWMADVFLSLIRLGLRPTDYCHRAKIGAVEPKPFDVIKRQDLSVVFNERTVMGGSMSLLPQYRVGQKFSDDFHDDEFQRKLDLVFRPQKGQLALRVGAGLGWLSRGRQSADTSERLLFFFTALEALLSDQQNDHFSPVADQIARFASIILCEGVKGRQSFHQSLKKLYGLRSNLVHRGARQAHALNANNIQHMAESCFSIVLSEVPLDQPHHQFLDDLRTASHGLDWPIKQETGDVEGDGIRVK